MDRYQNKYRISTARAPFWDYGSNGAYFVTLCIQNRIDWFGHVADGEMVLSEIGGIMKTEWIKTFEMRPDMNLHMGEYVIMPNHFHAIIGIGVNEYNDPSRRGAMHCASTGNVCKNKFGPQSKNLASVIRGFKTGVTKNARCIHPDFAWQSRYHDHIIRDDISYYTISAYIKKNPAKWSDDKLYSK